MLSACKPAFDDGDHRGAIRLNVFVVCFALSGCAIQHTVIISNPPGARVTIDKRYVGETPVTFAVHKDNWPASNTFPCKLELRGYHATDCTFSGQRWRHIVGDIFTLGITYLFRGPYGLRDEVRRDLEPLVTAEKVDEPRTPAAAPSPTPSEGRRCTTDQVLSMKHAGLDDEQVRRACE